MADAPWRVAERARADGLRVVGLFGRHAPRELVAAAGMVPVRIRPTVLSRSDDGHGAVRSQSVPDGLRGELSDEALSLLAALLGGELHWIDALLIGRDSEAHLKLFYVIRELAQEPEYRHLIPPLAFSDVLRLPFRTSAVYNRARLAELRETIAGWAAGAPAGADTAAITDAPAITDAALEAAISREREIAWQLRELDRLRSEQRVTAAEALLAGVAAETLPPAECCELLREFAAAAAAREPLARSPRVFLTGSEPDPSIYAQLEDLGLALVGDDQGRRGWLSAGDGAGDPIGRLADQYQLSPLGAARAGLDRVAHVAALARETTAEAVLQIILAHDEASGWELPELRALLPELPVLSVELAQGLAPDAAAALLEDTARSLRARVEGGRASGGAG